MNQHQVVHLDIKPDNLFISRDGTIKIGDFGMATRLPAPNMDKEGDRTYLPPELLNHNCIDYHADIFSLGLIVLEMAANVQLPENGPIWQQLREGKVEQVIGHHISPPLVDLIKSMLQPCPTDRPSAQALLNHPILQSLLYAEPGLLSSHSSSTSAF